MRFVRSATPHLPESGDVDSRDDADDVIVIVSHGHVTKAESAEEGEQPRQSRS